MNVPRGNLSDRRIDDSNIARRFITPGDTSNIMEFEPVV